MTIFSTWGLRTHTIKSRSAELLTLDASVATLHASGAGVKDVNVNKAISDCAVWKAARPTEVAALAAAVTDLETDMVAALSKGRSQLTNVMSTGVKPAGWRYVAFDPLLYAWANNLPVAEQLPATLSIAETMRINEAIRRVKLAIVYARDAMIRIASGKASAKEAQAYTDFFGVVDGDRIKKITMKFKILAIAFDTGPDIVDLRNTDFGKHCYASCFRSSLVAKGSVSLSLTGSVNMFLGRAFFGRGSYEKTSDDTITTLVHEFAHGAINAVDVAPVSATGAWAHPVVSEDILSDDYGASTTNSIQCSTVALDKLLAQFKPDFTVVNADSYGQFAARMLIDNKG